MCQLSGDVDCIGVAWNVYARSVRGVEQLLRRTADAITWSVSAASLTSAGSVSARGNRTDRPGNVHCHFSLLSASSLAYRDSFCFVMIFLCCHPVLAWGCIKRPDAMYFQARCCTKQTNLG